MRVVVRRLLAIVSVLILTMASIVPATAQSSDTVDVTGAIVAAPLSIEITVGSVAFGNIDSRATAQTGTVVAQGFLVQGNNGAQWVATTPFTINIVSPSTWTATACVATHNGLPASSLYLLSDVPANPTAAFQAFEASTAPIPNTCASPMVWTSNSSQSPAALTKYLGTWIQPSDTPRAFTATVRFSVSG